MKVGIVGSALALVLLLGLATGTAMGLEPVRNIPPAPHGASGGASLDSISRAIKQAAIEMDWYPVSDGSGEVVVSLMVRQRHSATVSIRFDQKDFWIDYRGSSNLEYTTSDLNRWVDRKEVVVEKGPRIHKNYNVWVQALADHIASRTGKVVADQRSQDPAPSPTLIADELEKLGQLRAQGVLTQEEFDAQKTKLLAR